MADREHIFICVPTTGNVLSTGCNWLLTRAMKKNADPKCPYHFSVSTINDRQPVEFARNTMIKNFMETDANRIWMIDNDMTPGANAFDLLETSGDIVAGYFLMFKHKSPTNPTTLQMCAFERLEDGRHVPYNFDPTGDRVIDVDSVGTGSCIIKRELFQDPAMVLDDTFTNLAGQTEHLHENYPAAPRAYFRRHYAPNGQVILGADLDFCERAKANGYSVRVNLDVPFGQVNKVNLNEVAELVQRYASGDKDADVTDGDISAIHDAWGNKEWAAPLPFLTATRAYAKSSAGPILECGSGATTMVLNHLASLDVDMDVTTLEHDGGWYELAQKRMGDTDSRHRIVHAPLNGSWYNLENVELPEKIGLVICDGPPNNGKSGRYGLFPAVKDRLMDGYAILMDDAHREKPVLDRWKKEFGVRVQMIDPSGRGIAVVTGDAAA